MFGGCRVGIFMILDLITMLGRHLMGPRSSYFLWAARIPIFLLVTKEVHVRLQGIRIRRNRGGTGVNSNSGLFVRRCRLLSQKSDAVNREKGLSKDKMVETRLLKAKKSEEIER